MKFRRLAWLILITLTACSSLVASKATSVPPTATLAQPQITTISAPSTQTIVSSFLDAWKVESYDKMYAMLSPVSKDAISADEFKKRYLDTANSMGLIKLTYSILSTLTNPSNAQVAYRVTFTSNLLGEFNRDMVMNLTLDNGDWKVQWDDSMILPELKGGNHLALEVKSPVRANIYDKNGNTMAAQTEAVALGVIPSQMQPPQTAKVLETLATVLNKSPLEIKGTIAGQENANWYFPVGEALAQDVQDHNNALSGLAGIVMNPFTSRLYYNGGIAPQVTGYVQTIPKEQLDQYKRLGYRGDERIGMTGLEKWGEKYLAGKSGASLYVVNPDGEILTRMVQSDSTPPQAIYTTIDSDFQRLVQRSMGGFVGAAVVMERDTGRILAMASSPSFDPNAFEPNNYNSGMLLKDIFGNDQKPLLNRATQGLYPLGSVFKIITMSAALESGLYTPESTYECGYYFTELDGYKLEDWTLAFGVQPSGHLTLPQGLMRSCNPFFYHIGLDLYRQHLPKIVSTMARGFGLGSATGIEQLPEAEGQVLDPTSEADAVQAAIGQSTLQVTPLQVVDFIAAMGNGGTLYRPQVVEKVVGPDGTPVFTFKPEVRGKLPIKPETMKIITDAMRSVITDPKGTAHSVFTGIDTPVYGKTGTAQSSDPNAKAFAWFAGYTDSPRQDKPNVAIVVLCENAGEGSQFAAPIWRRILELYYDGKPGRLFPWESSYWVTPTPTPLVTDTPIPAPTSPETPTPIGAQGKPTPIQ